MILFILLIALPAIIYPGNFILAQIGLFLLRNSQYDYTPFVSIIIAARNEKKSIAKTLNCVLNQRYPGDRFEVILVNDASKDRTLVIAQEFSFQYGNLKIINQPEPCPYNSRKKYAMEKGIAHARGEILLFTDADSRMSDLWLRSIVHCYDPEGTIGAVCSFVCLPHEK
ncbi:MAG: glycosyltransferase [Spirochaetales bacterium]|nr:glycosyltransferase [Spirochaetales bacterium]